MKCIVLFNSSENTIQNHFERKAKKKSLCKICEGIKAETIKRGTLNCYAFTFVNYFYWKRSEHKYVRKTMKKLIIYLYLKEIQKMFHEKENIYFY